MTVDGSFKGHIARDARIADNAAAAIAMFGSCILKDRKQWEWRDENYVREKVLLKDARYLGFGYRCITWFNIPLSAGVHRQISIPIKKPHSLNTNYSSCKIILGNSNSSNCKFSLAASITRYLCADLTSAFRN